MLDARKVHPSCVCAPIPTKINIAASLIAGAHVNNAEGVSPAEYQRLDEGAGARVPMSSSRRNASLTRETIDEFWAKLVVEMYGKPEK